ncbi:MAG: tripartite tricarboxylate transporter substrate binding protein [Burkholderiales bacterium]|nr:tripartite tricarboxylate transporter substrate binding protein [Burkholderiales bacterium]
MSPFRPGRRTFALRTAALPLAMSGPLAALASTASAQQPEAAWPVRPVRMITGSVGGTSDIIARFTAHRLSERWKQQVLVDNRAGLGGIIGSQIGAKAAPDGYTLIVGQIGTHASANVLYKNLGYDQLRDFVPISLMSNSAIALVVHPSVPVNNLKEFIAFARAKPGMTYASAGGATSSQLSGELFNLVAGTKLLHVPYKGSGFALPAVMSGETQSAFLASSTVATQVRGGKLRAIAVLSKERFPGTPDIPSTTEQGVPGLEANVWFGLFAPAGMSRALVTRINRDVVGVLGTPEAREALLAAGAEPTPTTPEAFAAFQKSEIAKWTRVIREAGIKVE